MNEIEYKYRIENLETILNKRAILGREVFVIHMVDEFGDTDDEHLTYLVESKLNNDQLEYIWYIPSNITHITLANGKDILKYANLQDATLTVVGGQNLESTSHMFHNKTIGTVDLTYLRPSNLKCTTYMFALLKTNKIIGLNKLDMTHVEEAEAMFWEAHINYGETIEIGNMDNIVNARWMFASAITNCNLDIHGINLYKLKSADRMFKELYSNGSVSIKVCNKEETLSSSEQLDKSFEQNVGETFLNMMSGLRASTVDLSKFSLLGSIKNTDDLHTLIITTLDFEDVFTLIISRDDYNKLLELTGEIREFTKRYLGRVHNLCISDDSDNVREVAMGCM